MKIEIKKHEAYYTYNKTKLDNSPIAYDFFG